MVLAFCFKSATLIISIISLPIMSEKFEQKCFRAPGYSFGSKGLGSFSPKKSSILINLEKKFFKTQKFKYCISSAAENL